jgi:serine/threonine-protein kinase
MIPQTLGRYRIQAEIARGAMGKVYRGYDPLCRRVVAIKTIRPEYLIQRNARDYLQRFQREARAAGALSHPNIVTIYDVSDGYFVMEYLEGITLLNLIARRGGLPPTEALDIVAPIADALDHAHRQGIIHRDIKPSNIMILSDGQPKIMDFGVAHLESTIMTTDGESFGSPPYMSPEQILGEEPTAQADIFSLGVVTYELLTGQRPFAGDKIPSLLFRVVNLEPPSPRKWKADLPRRYDDVFNTVLAKRPANRYATAADFVRALQLSKLERIELSTPIDEVRAAPVVPYTTQSPSGRETVRLPGMEKAPREATLRSPEMTGRQRGAPVHLTLRLRHATFVATTALLAAACAAIVAVFVSASANSPLPPTPVEGLRIETAPPGATVWLNGEEVGVSPLVVGTVPDGRVDLRVAKKGFLPAEQTLDVEAGVFPPLALFDMMPARTSLFLTSEPEGAIVRVDGQPVGESPIENVPIHPGNHMIQVLREGYRPWSFELQAEPGESLHLVARLTPVGTEPRQPTREGDLVELGPDATPPRKIRGEFAIYPQEAIEQGDEGTVTVEMIVTEGGHAMDLRVLQSAGEVLDRALLEALWAWRFQPAERDGVRVRVRWRVSQSFRRGQESSGP